MAFRFEFFFACAAFLVALTPLRGADPATPAPAPAAGPEAPGGGAAPPSGFGSLIVPMVLCFAVIYFIVMLPEKKKQKARMAMIRAVKKGDKVVTTSGIIGKAIRVDDKEVTLQVDKDNDVRMQFMKSAIHEVIPEGAEVASEKEPGK